MNFPKLITMSRGAAGTIKTAGAIGAIIASLETYAQTGNWKLAAAIAVTALLSGNVVRGDA